MTIRKTGAVTGRITQLESTAPESGDAEGITAVASAGGVSPGWVIEDEAGLAAENQEADGE